MTQIPFGLKQEPTRERVSDYLNALLAKLKASPFNKPKHSPRFKEHQNGKS